MANNTKKFSDVNLYDLLGVSIEAEQSEIRKAYRKRALDCHPDKNPDNPQAAERFHELSKALEILSDATARAAYDKVLKAKKAAELRTKQLDSKRQKLKEELEQRERAALHKLQAGQPYSTVRKSDEEVLQEQIDRLRREGSKLLEEEQLAMREQLKRSYNEQQQRQQAPAVFDSAQHRIKIKWKADKTKEDKDNGGYTEQQLMQYLKKYGDVVALVMNTKIPGRAMVELKTREACDMVLAYEKGNPANPLHFKWVTPPAEEKAKGAGTTTTSTSRDYEDLVMRKLRQAEERKRLIAQMMQDEGDE
ncbi:dnaJ homolog subfamily C member 17 [Drosophila sulfurigaster albostrigata]|uniref:dnaJ homolog subfamily C member 17 n=1 Tax=Drosophila nasuta TaxID=42062 RepID=UPI00295F43E3|nr:dnaJ homolog subfamily C member 17 [Drosophila nasuta]XP_062124952.1 dnaJ homolog subfamily C member 17 [Drosophila sulfurigaster albostrigata]